MFTAPYNDETRQTAGQALQTVLTNSQEANHSLLMNTGFSYHVAPSADSEQPRLERQTIRQPNLDGNTSHETKSTELIKTKNRASLRASHDTSQMNPEMKLNAANNMSYIKILQRR